ncbi:hypothetical protein COB64_02320 [Candidatus Wolfebacteria bacterium]|nr:MAG: hypothetical protein COB64_02320 [Candidatus Wolfebacteria bacterium]
MESLKSFLFTLLIVVILGGAGYWAFTSIDSGKELALNNTSETLVDEEEDVGEIFEIEDEAILFIEDEVEELPVEDEPDPSLLALKADLEDLRDRKILLEPGDSGLLVLRIQKFLNFYDPDLNLGEDQDFGPSTRSAVEKYQEDVGLNPDGGIGPKTIEKMLELFG